jgi:hypothetical protein
MKGSNMSVTATAVSNSARTADVPTLPTAPRRLARSRRLAGGTGQKDLVQTPTVSSFILR